MDNRYKKKSYFVFATVIFFSLMICNSDKSSGFYFLLFVYVLLVRHIGTYTNTG